MNKHYEQEFGKGVMNKSYEQKVLTKGGLSHVEVGSPAPIFNPAISGSCACSV